MSYANTLFSTASQLAVGWGSRSARSAFAWAKKSATGCLTALPGISFRLSFVFIALICLVGMIDSLHLAKRPAAACREEEISKKASGSWPYRTKPGT
jgi:hypothetical protein